MNASAEVVGVVTATAAVLPFMKATGTIPQNVNFAVKGTEALGFLRRAGVEPTLRESAPTELSAAEVGERAHPSTVFIRCEK